MPFKDIEYGEMTKLDDINIMSGSISSCPVTEFHVCNNCFHYRIIRRSVAKSNIMLDIMHFSYHALHTRSK